jgi:FMN phosphatase YigB (HAD superfamily)
MAENFTRHAPLVFLFDVDNTLLDNDRFAADLRGHLDGTFGGAQAQRYWDLYEALRQELGYADYLGAVQRFRKGLEDEPALLDLAHFLIAYPFAERLFPHSLDVLTHLRHIASTAILSDGDVVFQPHKIRVAGLWQAVQGRVLIYVHKERVLDAMQRHFPARHYVMVDDKPQILAAMKQALGARLTTVFVRQGHYARMGGSEATPPDITLQHIGDMLTLSPQTWQVSP